MDQIVASLYLLAYCGLSVRSGGFKSLSRFRLDAAAFRLSWKVVALKKASRVAQLESGWPA